MERERFRILSEEPLFSMLLRSRQRVLSLPVLDFVREWALQWVEDVEILVRSREFMVSTVTGILLSRFLQLVGGFLT